MPVTANETALVEFGMDARTTLQTPLPPAVVVHVALGPVPFQVPCTVAPVTRLCRQSWTVICTVAVHVLPLLAATPLRLPTWRLGAVTVIAIDCALLLGLLSASFCVAVRMWPLIAAPPVAQLKVRVALAPVASPVIVGVPDTVTELWLFAALSSLRL